MSLPTHLLMLHVDPVRMNERREEVIISEITQLCTTWKELGISGTLMTGCFKNSPSDPCFLVYRPNMD